VLQGAEPQLAQQQQQLDLSLMTTVQLQKVWLTPWQLMTMR
jgi:hypothetical protein